nr:MAG TPA: glutaredoxin-like protein [Caudoviricetes sp.]
MKVTVYSKSSCIQCEMTKMYLDQHKIKFETVDVFETEGVLEKIKSYGFKGMPVVVLDDNFDNAWVGYNLDRLEELEKGNKYD